MLGEIETADLSRLSRSEIERIFSRFRGDILEIENIIQTILGLARRGRSESPYKPENVFIREVLSAEIKKIERAFHVLVQVGIEKDYEVFIDPDLFSILVDNLLRNALRHGRGEIAVRVAEPSPKGSIIVFVEDSGPGLDLDFLEVANSSFLHRDLGIGLTLCKEVCRITGWRLKFSNRQPHGCSASIEIPSFTEIFQGKPSVFSWQLDAVIRHKTDSI
jgi:signal transduction histidine kinase